MVSSVSEVLALVLGSAAITENHLICLPLKEGWKWKLFLHKLMKVSLPRCRGQGPHLGMTGELRGVEEKLGRIKRVGQAS